MDGHAPFLVMGLPPDLAQIEVAIAHTSNRTRRNLTTGLAGIVDFGFDLAHGKAHVKIM